MDSISKLLYLPLQ